MLAGLLIHTASRRSESFFVEVESPYKHCSSRVPLIWLSGWLCNLSLCKLAMSGLSHLTTIYVLNDLSKSLGIYGGGLSSSLE